MQEQNASNSEQVENEETGEDIAAPADASLDEAIEEGGEKEALNAEIADLKDKLLRAVAETENLRRRAAREREEAHKFAVSKFATDLCEVADNFERAVSSVSDEAKSDNVVRGLLEGVEMTEQALLRAFERHGIQRFDPTGEKFDPNRHEAMTEIEDPAHPAGTVVQVFQKGFLINDRLLRPARVIVSRGGSKEEPGATINTVA